MKAGFVFLTLVFSFLLARSQANYYVFLQSDNGRPFYVRVHQKRYEATFNGLLSIPGFKTGSSYIRIGFPGMQEGESLFRVVLQHQDMALQLRNKDQGGWGLYDWGSGQWIAPVSDTVLAPVQDSALVQTVKRSNAFAGLMAAVVNDSSMLYSSREQRLELPAAVARIKDAVSDTMASNKGNMPVEADIAVKSDSNGQKGLALSGVADSGNLATAQNTAGNQFKDSVQLKDSVRAAAEPLAGLATDTDRKADSVIRTGKEPSRQAAADPTLAANMIRRLMVNDVKGGRQILYELMEPDGSRDSVRV
ncbi:MAG TPA: hypothetical protein VFS31_08120, partial [Chitinophagaceae bacterium]|nr:hypothetical protein [Chitinophagaceae bacterium]